MSAPVKSWRIERSELAIILAYSAEAQHRREISAHQKQVRDVQFECALSCWVLRVSTQIAVYR